MIVVHDYKNDPTIKFLCELYDASQSTVLDRSDSKSHIREELTQSDDILLLGHGCPFGLGAVDKNERTRFARMLVDSNLADTLRGKEIIGIWCFANKFAEKYGLGGLFSGMIISEPAEADMFLGIDISRADIDRCSAAWVNAFNELRKRFTPDVIPRMMSGYCWNDGSWTYDQERINNFNFASWHYYPTGV